MKNNLFNQATALVTGSLMVFSGQALAMKSNKKEVSNSLTLREVEVLIAQQNGVIPDVQQNIVLETLSEESDKLAECRAQIETLESETAKSSAVDLLNALESTVRNVLADLDVDLSKGDLEVILDALNLVESQLGDAEANLRALIPVEGEDARVAADCINEAIRALEDAGAKLKLAIQSAE